MSIVRNRDQFAANASPPLRSVTDRRTFLAALAAVAGGSMALAQTPVAPKRRPAPLQAPQGIDSLATRSRIVLELSGKLKVADPDPSSKKPPREAEVKAESIVDFDERIVFNRHNQISAAARHYHEATVNAWVAGHASSHLLREECYETRLLRSEGTWQQYCPTQPMQAREVDLTRLPINTVVIDQLLPASPVKPDDSWSPSDQVVAELFQLEAVHASKLIAHVTTVEKGVATIEFEGDVDGTVNSVSTQLKVTGSLHAALGEQCALVTWLGVSIVETRAVSQAEPGFSLTARINLIRQEEPTACRDVSGAELRDLANTPDDARWILQVHSVPGRYQFLADRRWKAIVDTGEEAILRLIEKNQVVAQCNITRLPKLAAGQQLTMAGMQDDIKRSLDKSLQSLVQSSERMNSGGMRVLRCEAVGTSSDVPVRWVYAHASDDSGRRVSLVFTMSAEASETFGLADEQITGSFELLADATNEQPTPATESASKGGRSSVR